MRRCWTIVAISAVAACQLVTGTGDLEVVEPLDVVDDARGAEGGAGGSGTASVTGGTAGMSGIQAAAIGNASTSSAGGGGECFHSECKPGAPLDASCSACAEAVCSVDSFCCITQWDGACVTQVDTFCNFDCPQ